MYIRSIIGVTLIVGVSTVFGDSPSTWTGTSSPYMSDNSNWDNAEPDAGIAVFNGNGAHSPISRSNGFSFSEMQFTESTQVAVINSIDVTGLTGVVINPGVTAIFDICEHQPMTYQPGKINVLNGSAGEGGGTVFYNLQGYGQLYANLGSSDTTVIHVVMTGGNNHFQINGLGTSIFDNVSSGDTNDQIYINTYSNLTIRGLSTNTINGVIEGPGSLTKTGASTLIFNNDNTYTGDTLVSEGTLQVNGTLASNVTISAGASLQGNGSLSGDLLLNGVVSPGNSIGILNVTNYASTDSSVFSCEINSSNASDQIIATGTMTLAGTLDVIPLDLAFTGPETYVILEATEGVSGTFSTTQSAAPGLIALNYAANEVTLTYLPLSVVGLHCNAVSPANCFSTLSGSDVNAVSRELLALSFSDIQNAFNHMQPSQFSAQTWTQLSNGLLVRSSYSKHVNEFFIRNNCSNEYGFDVWLDVLGEWQGQGKESCQFGYNDWTAGVSLGTDVSCKQFRFGGAASYTYSGVNWDQSAGHGQISSFYGGGYGGWSDDVGYLIFSTLGAYNHYDSTRYISIGNINRHAYGSHNGWEVLTGVEGGAYFEVNPVRLGPFGRFDYIYLWQEGYQESGANSLNLQVDSRHDQLVQSQVGAVCTSRYECNLERIQGIFIPRVEVSYINQTPIVKADYQASFKNSACEFNVSGWNFEHNLGAIGVALTYLTPSERIGVSVQYDGQFGSQYYNQSAHLLLDIKY